MKSINGVRLNERDIELLKKIKQVVYKILPEGELIFFGSRARGEASPDSDWDILVLTETVTSELEHNLWAFIFNIELEGGLLLIYLYCQKTSGRMDTFAIIPFAESLNPKEF